MTPLETYTKYRRMPWQDMYEYSPMLRELAHGSVLEIGVRDGVSTSAFLLGLDDKMEGHLWSVDCNHTCGELFQNERWTFIHACSQEVVLPETKFDVILIDGSHRYEDVKHDINRFSKLLTEDGVLLVHDVHPSAHCPANVAGCVEGAPQAFWEFITEHPNCNHYVLPGLTGMGVIHV